MAQEEGGKSPLIFRDAHGNFLPLDLIRVIQDRQRGSTVGFSELSRLLEERKSYLEDLIKQQDNAQQETNDHG